MNVIINVSATRFSLNGIEYYKNYITRVAENNIKLINAYDSCDVLLDWVNYSQISVNGNTYTSAILLQQAVIDILFARSVGQVIPDASDTVSGLVNTITQTFKGNKTIKGESAITGSALTIVNASNQIIARANNNVSWEDSEGIAIHPYSHADTRGYSFVYNCNASTEGLGYGISSHVSCKGLTFGTYSNASGLEVESRSFSETAVGIYNEIINAISITLWNARDLAFSVGIGSDITDRKTGFSVFKSGKIRFLPIDLTTLHSADLRKGDIAIDLNGDMNIYNGTVWKKVTTT